MHGQGEYDRADEDESIARQCVETTGRAHTGGCRRRSADSVSK